MLDSFILSFKLKNAYRVNSIIYSLKHTPLIKRILPYSLYNNKGIKILANIISTILEIISIFFGKILYMLIFYLGFIPLYKDTSLAFINVFVFLTIIGGFMNTYLFTPSIDKYYAIFLMRFDAKKYTLSNYYYALIKCVVGLLPLTIIFGLKFNLPLLICILIPIFVISIKNIFNAFTLSSYLNKKELLNENKQTPFALLIAVLLLCLGYSLPYFNIGVNETTFYVIFILILIAGIISFIYITKYNYFTKMCKETLKKNEIIPDKTGIEMKAYKDQITNVAIDNTDKEGYAYFNYIFTKRHRKLLTKATKNISFGLIIFFVLAILSCLIFPSIDNNINDLLKNSIPYYLFVLYFLNRGQKICQTMFMNCDRSMLTYRFYREKTAILLLFEERLKTITKLNIIPGLLIAIFTDILIFITGGASISLYIITFLSIISMSIFFSVHYLVLYYLLQPYDVNLDIKNPAFMSICGFTYFICYMASRVQIPTLLFGIGMIIFTVVYSILSLYIAYKYAPSRFKLRV